LWKRRVAVMVMAMAKMMMVVLETDRHGARTYQGPRRTQEVMTLQGHLRKRTCPWEGDRDLARRSSSKERWCLMKSDERKSLRYDHDGRWALRRRLKERVDGMGDSTASRRKMLLKWREGDVITLVRLGVFSSL
jgi:hypothetical protein